MHKKYRSLYLHMPTGNLKLFIYISLMIKKLKTIVFSSNNEVNFSFFLSRIEVVLFNVYRFENIYGFDHRIKKT